MAESFSSDDHNRLAQTGAAVNPDPALDIRHEQFHAHLHHSSRAEQGRSHDPSYAVGTTFEPNVIPQRDPQGYTSHPRLDSRTPTTTKLGADVGDVEKGSTSPADGSSEQGEDGQKYSLIRLYKKYRIFFHIFVFLLFTGWWIASLVLHVHNKNWIIPFLLWGTITLQLIFFHVPITIVTRPMHLIWNQTGVRMYNLIPEKFRIHVGAWLVIAVILIG